MLLRFKSQNHPQQIDARGASEEIDDRETHPEFFGKLDERFHFTLDVAAAAHNAKTERYFDRTLDGLIRPWGNHERIWCNPPYSDIAEWVAKAWSEWENPEGPRLIVLLLPANRTEQRWWQDLVEPVRDRDDTFRSEFIRGRQRFIKPGKTSVGPNERPPFGNVLLVWRRLDGGH